MAVWKTRARAGVVYLLEGNLLFLFLAVAAGSKALLLLLPSTNSVCSRSLVSWVISVAYRRHCWFQAGQEVAGDGLNRLRKADVTSCSAIVPCSAATNKCDADDQDGRFLARIPFPGRRSATSSPMSASGIHLLAGRSVVLPTRLA